jgi:RNA polymerase sigma factor (sigma-70 family)
VPTGVRTVDKRKPLHVYGTGRLSREEEVELGRIIQDASVSKAERIEARNALVMANVGLVFKLLEQSWGTDDRASVGLVTLVHAADRWDPSRNVTFGTYAYTAIHRELIRNRSEDRLVRVPHHHFAKSYKPAKSAEVREASAAATATLGTLDGATFDIEEPQRGQAESERAEKRALAVELLNSLPDREREVIRRRFGVGCEPETLSLVGARLRVTKERIRQIEEAAIERMRKSIQD